MLEDIFKQFGEVFSPPTVTKTFTHKQHILCIAIRFTRIIHEWLTGPQLQQVRQSNKHNAGDGTCATHDYIDANMAMLKAYSLETDIPEKEVQLHLTSVMDVLNEAWTIARECDFHIPNIDALNNQP